MAAPRLLACGLNHEQSDESTGSEPAVGGVDVNRNLPGKTVDRQPTRLRLATIVGGQSQGFGVSLKFAGRAFGGQSKDDRRSGHRLSALIVDADQYRFGCARARVDDNAFAPHDNDTDLFGQDLWRRIRGYGLNGDESAEGGRNYLRSKPRWSDEFHCSSGCAICDPNSDKCATAQTHPPLRKPG
jgi:hypothetical protein